MVSESYTVGSYALQYQGNPNIGGLIAHVLLYDESEKLIGWITFYKEGSELPDAYLYHDKDENITRGFMSMYENQLPNVVDMLRNEKPCKFRFSKKDKSDRPPLVVLFTGKEPVGEGEE